MKNKYIIRNNCIVIYGVRFEKEYEILIDTEDFEKVNSIRGTWSITTRTKIKNDIMYAVYNDWKTKERSKLHRLILNAPKGAIVDHINHNGLDNRKSNLRYTTNSKNLHNRKNMEKNSSGAIGVCYCKQTGKWKARICINKKEIWLGRFDEFEEAKKVVENARRSYLEGV